MVPMATRGGAKTNVQVFAPSFDQDALCTPACRSRNDDLDRIGKFMCTVRLTDAWSFT